MSKPAPTDSGPGSAPDATAAAARPAKPPVGARGMWPMRDLPSLGWLVLAVTVALVHPFVPESRWLMVHLVVLGALTHAVMVWSAHFAQALLKTRPELDARATQNRRLLTLLAGTTLVMVGVPTAQWWLTLAGATLVTGAVLWHAVQLWRRVRASLAPRFGITIRYYVAAAVCLPIGAGFGATLARGLGDDWNGRLLLAHLTVNLLGWIGLTVTGTLLTLWPTMLRTPIDPAAERRARQALPVLLAALAGVVAAALLDSRVGAAIAFVGYLAGLAWWGRALLGPARRARIREFAPASVAAALIWWVLALLAVIVRLLTVDSWVEFADGLGPTAAVLVAGFAAQLLLGALSYLLPSVIGGGKRVVRAAQAWFDRWGTLRLLVVNAGLAVCLLPVPGLVRVTVSVLVLVALAAFIPLMIGGVRAGAAAKAGAGSAGALAVRAGAVRAGAVGARAVGARAVGERSSSAGSASAAGSGSAAGSRGGVGSASGVGRAAGPGEPDRMPSVWSSGQAVVAVSVLVLALVGGVAADPAAAGLDTNAEARAAAAAVTPTGNTTTVQVVAQGMRFEPASVTVPAGDRLVVELRNDDPTDVHDLQLLGQRTPRLRHEQTATLDLGVVGASAQGWCTIVGHRQMGMVFDVVVTGADGGGTAAGAGADGSAAGAGAAGAGHSGHGAGHATDQAATQTPVRADPDAQLQHLVDPRLPTLPPQSGPRTHTLTLTVTEADLEVAPGVRQRRWTYNGGPVGPTLHGRVGDVFDITLVNDGSIGHSIDFHAGALAPDRPMRTIAPGESLQYRFTATRAGIWMYHCSTMPMSAHIAAGMHGAVVIEPDGLPAVDRQYALTQSEVFVTPGTGGAGQPAAEVDADLVTAERPTFVTFNGIANQYAQVPLTARVGERVRIWVLDAGPNRSSSFHIVGGQFDTVYHEGAYLLGPRAQGAGAQAFGLTAAQGGFVELTFPEPGTYPLVSHVMVDAERGAKGFVKVTE
ncbi:nitrite reductase (NO-forming) [Kineosphaera limosa]|uniref:Copper-containing nitrite reductase n=1 Tax=Kineosphaera limosa NBRC 100340 TaxID=1184609 RepID=K6X1U8_9MICO|nr:multicopper oxidase domain-containing protein [Kineosphaera limosa]NYE00959.1 nitrite reductase (NO-forming) [Kineosphaera limosa]GAB98307.1 putative oxidoreductase [Kineosphaera limosa NBRC 100340]